VAAVDVIILHPLAAAGAGPLERRLVEARAALAERHRRGFVAAGAETARIHAGVPDGRPFGERLAELLRGHPAGHGLVLLGSGALPLATVADRRTFVAAARVARASALANNRFSADAIALSAPAVAVLDRVPRDLPGDNALPRWLDEIAGVPVADLRARWRLGMDLDSPLDVLLIARSVGRGRDRGRASSAATGPGSAIEAALEGVRRVMTDRRAELVVAGRSSAATLDWLERTARCRVRALIEERGLRASSRLAVAELEGSAPEASASRQPRSALGLLLDRDGPEALGERLAELGDAALIDSRVLLAHRLGGAEAAWPPAEDRFASDLLEVRAVDDHWLAALTHSAATARIPIVLGGHSLVGPGIRLVFGGR
jgi:hypothetical protein